MAGRKSDSLLKTAVRKMLQRYLKDNDISIKSGTDVNSVMRKLMSVLLEGTFDVELNEEPRYSKYDCRNKKTGEYCYLLDRLMGLESHARISEDAEARILEEAVESSYRKGGINACIGKQEVSKETVMNKLHTLEFPLLEPLKEKPEKRAATGCRCRKSDIFSNADVVSGKTQQKQAWKTGRYAGIQYSLSIDKKDSGTKKSYMGIVRKEKIGYSKDSYQILNRTQV